MPVQEPQDSRADPEKVGASAILAVEEAISAGKLTNDIEGWRRSAEFLAQEGKLIARQHAFTEMLVYLPTLATGFEKLGYGPAFDFVKKTNDKLRGQLTEFLAEKVRALVLDLAKAMDSRPIAKERRRGRPARSWMYQEQDMAIHILVVRRMVEKLEAGEKADHNRTLREVIAEMVAGGKLPQKGHPAVKGSAVEAHLKRLKANRWPILELLEEKNSE